MYKRLLRLALLIVSFTIVLTACSNSGGDPAKTVEQYLQAKVEGNEQVIRQLLCTEKEADAFQEINAFTSVSGAHIEGMKCQRLDDSDVVKCDGKIVATYGKEDTEFPLTSYRVVQEDGEWKWCGEAPAP
jgi:hypothetical protein